MALSNSSWWSPLIPTAATSWSQPDKAWSCFGGKILVLTGHWGFRACAGLWCAPSHVCCFDPFFHIYKLSVAGERERRKGAACLPVFLICCWLLPCLVCSQPTPGYFTEDQTLDFLLQIQDGVGMKKVRHRDSNQSKCMEGIYSVYSPVQGTVRNRRA
jgi:hypothetical protein